MRTKLIQIGIIAISLILAVSSFWNDSLIVDEIPHVGAGYSYVKAWDYRLNPDPPPLAKALAAIPLLFFDLNQEAFRTRFWLTDINGQWDFGRFLIFQSGNNADLITKVVKFPVLLFFVLAAVLMYKWTKKLYGQFAALTALALFSLSPTILAHSRFVTTDVPALFGILLATFFFIKYLESPTKKNTWLAGLAFGIAILTKFSTFLIIPYFLVLALVKNKNKLLGTILIFIIGFAFVIWPVYSVFTLNYPPERQRADTEFILGSFGNRTLADLTAFMADKPIVRGLSEYVLGLLMVGQRAVGGNTTYFLGEVSGAGWRFYFPIVYALKEPLAWWILVVFSLAYLGWQVKKPSSIRNLGSNIKWFLKNHFVEFAMLLWLAIYWTTSIKSNLNIGVRHLLPTYPFAIILVSGQLSRIKNFIKQKSKKSLTVYYLLLTILFGWYMAENLRVWPYYLTYFNQLAGGASGGYRYVVDSNLDLGQDLKRLSQWVEKNKIDKIHLDYFGWSDPVYYLRAKVKWLTAGQYKNAQDFINKTGGGYLAVSATFFMGSRENPEKSYIWLQRFEPVAVIGNSIWVWKF